jgi:hypothetical protein
MKILALLLLALPLAAADGRVVNQATGKPQSGATVTLYKLTEAGPEALESVKTGADGAFRIDQSIPQMGFLQAAFEGVLYTKMLRPGMPQSGVEIEVFPSTKSRAGVKVTNHMLLLEPAGDKLSVRESYFFLNEGKTTWNDPDNGTLRFQVQAEPLAPVEVNATGPGSMPIRKAAEKSNTPGVMKVDFAVKPGESRVDLAYNIPFASPGRFKTRFLLPAEQTMIAVPNGVEVKGEGLKDRGKEPTTQAAIFDVERNDIDLTLSGSGELSSPESAGASEGPGIDQIHARPYDKLYWILGLSFAVLALGFLILLRREARQ